MFRPIPFPTPSLLVFLIAAHTAFADTENTRTFRILFPDRPAKAPQSLHLFDGTSSRLVELPKMNFSPVYNLASGDVTVTLLPNPVTDPLSIPKAAPTLLIPKTLTHFYLIVFSDPENPITPVRIKGIDADRGKLQNGDSLWFNLTDYEIAGQLGSQPLLMDPMSRTILKPPVQGAESYDAQIAYRVAGEPDIHPICRTVWMHNPQSRDVVFIVLKPNSSTPRIDSFRDTRD